MVQGIGDDSVFFREEGFEYTAVGIEAGCVENRVFCLEVIGNGGLQFLVDILRSADETHG